MIISTQKKNKKIKVQSKCKDATKQPRARLGPTYIYKPQTCTHLLEFRTLNKKTPAQCLWLTQYSMYRN